MNEELLAEIINGMRMNQQQGAFGNVTDNELQRFVADPVSNTNAINAMRSDNKEAVMAQAVNEMKALQSKGAAGNGMLTTDEINRFVYLRNMLNPNLPQEEPVNYNTMPVDIDGASAGIPMSQKELNFILNRIR